MRQQSNLQDILKYRQEVFSHIKKIAWLSQVKIVLEDKAVERTAYQYRIEVS